MTSSLYPSTGNFNVKSVCLQHKVTRASLPINDIDHIDDKAYYQKIAVTSGTTILVTGVTGRQVEVESLNLVATTAGTIDLRSASTSLTGAMLFAINGSFNSTYDDGVLKCASGENLSIVTTNTVNGFITYKLV